MKKNSLRPFGITLAAAKEKQLRKIQKKFRKLEETKLGKSLKISGTTKLEKLPIFDYDDYKPFFEKPFEGALIYPLRDYERVRTSGTSGKEKWFMIPRAYIEKSIVETTIPMILLSSFDGKKISLDYGDTMYVNIAPRPFVGGMMAAVASGKTEKTPFFNIVPNLNLPFDDKVSYLVNHHNDIDFAVTQASILVSRVIPQLKKPFSLKGLFCSDTAIAESNFDPLTSAMGVPPKTAYGSTETLDCSIPSAEHKLGFFLDWRRGYFEFVRRKSGEDEENQVLGIDETKVGETYQLIFTSLETELTRYNTMNALKCIASGDNLLGIDYPIFKFHARLEKTVSLNNFTRISEDELIGVLRACNVQFVEFTTRVGMENGLEYLMLYIETLEPEDAKSLETVIHQALRNSDKDYKELSDYYGYVPIKVIVVPAGSFAKYLMNKKATAPKVERILMREEEFEKLERAWRF